MAKEPAAKRWDWKVTMDDDLTSVRSARQCEEMATVDAYDEEEQTAGWHACLSDVLDVIDEVEVLGDKASYQGLVQQGNLILMNVRRNKKTAAVSLASITFLDAPAYVKTWVKAYAKFASC